MKTLIIACAGLFGLALSPAFAGDCYRYSRSYSHAPRVSYGNGHSYSYGHLNGPHGARSYAQRSSSRSHYSSSYRQRSYPSSRSYSRTTYHRSAPAHRGSHYRSSGHGYRSSSYGHGSRGYGNSFSYSQHGSHRHIDARVGGVRIHYSR